MPGFASDIATFHWFLRPHAQDTKIGFALFGSRSFNILTKNDPNSLQNLQFFSQNLSSMLPLSSFVFRRVTSNLEIGDILADVFIMVSSSSNIFLQICIKFLFNPEKLTKNIINIMSSSTVKSQRAQQQFNQTTTSNSTTRTHSNATSGAPDLPQDDDDTQIPTKNGTNNDNTASTKNS